jgi:hypothetical protein
VIQLEHSAPHHEKRDDHERHARYLLIAHAVRVIAQAVAQVNVPVMLVKGAALARTVYPKPWLRPMNDIDLLVMEEDRLRVLEALESSGCEVFPSPADRRYSATLLGETGVAFSTGGAELLIEVHHRLDKVVRRPIDYAAIAERAVHFHDLPGLSVPCPVDHALLVILHASSSEFRHEVAWSDLELLFGVGIDFDELSQRARTWGLATATFVAAMMLRLRGSQQVPEALLQGLVPARSRQRVLGRLFPNLPTAECEPQRSGLKWIAAQAPLHDNLYAYLRGIATYSGARMRDRLHSQRLLAIWGPARTE